MDNHNIYSVFSYHPEDVFEPFNASVDSYKSARWRTEDERNIEKLIEIAEILYDMLGIHIRDIHGNLRDGHEIRRDLDNLRPDIKMTFQDLMKF